jgi:hypothetical protein
MKTRFTRHLLIVLVGSLAVLKASAATRICSVYLESYSALQAQLFLGAQVFEAPQLGALPMMITMGLPGAAQMDNGKPVALHVLDIGAGKTGLVIELTPSTTAEAYLQAIAGADKQLPPPVEGLYVLEKGVAARIVGTRLLLAPKADDPEALLGKEAGALPAMPALPGVIRVSVSPAALKPLLENFKKTLAALPATGAPNAEQGRRSMEAAFNFYALFLDQIDALHIGLNIQAEGLFIRSRLAPKPGSDIAATVATIKPIPASQLAFIEKDSLFSFASGNYTLPPALKRQIVDLYTQMAASSPLYEASQTNELTTVMNQSMRVIGAPMAFTGNLPTNSQALLVQGVMGVSNPGAYLNDQLAMMKTPAFQKLMKLSGMVLPEPTQRGFKGLTVYTWKSLFDEKALAKALRDALPTNTPPEKLEAVTQASMASMGFVMKLFGGGYEYAATSKELVFGMGSPAMIEQAVGRMQAPAGSSPEAERIRKLLAPSAAPHAMGRLSLGGVLELVMSTQPELAASLKKDAQALPASEGTVFADWVASGEILSALLIPPSEIKALTAQTQAIQAQAMQKSQKGPAREKGE